MNVRNKRSALPRGLIRDASQPYLRAGPGLFAYFFALGKLRADPAYRAILERGLLTGREQILDLGAGQGLLNAWLQAAAACADRGDWPRDWPPSPRPGVTRGIELKRKDVWRAARALGSRSHVEHGDIREADFGRTDAVVILDVLHYLKRDDQADVLRRVRSSLSAQGTLLLRVCDAEAGVRYAYTQAVDWAVMRLRGHAGVKPHSRSIAEWSALLLECGFACDSMPMSEGTPFANVMFVARAADSP